MESIYLDFQETAYFPDGYTILHFPPAMYLWSSFFVALPGFDFTIFYFSYFKYAV